MHRLYDTGGTQNEKEQGRQGKGQPAAVCLCPEGDGTKNREIDRTKESEGESMQRIGQEYIHTLPYLRGKN